MEAPELHAPCATHSSNLWELHSQIIRVCVCVIIVSHHVIPPAVSRSLSLRMEDRTFSDGLAVHKVNHYTHLLA